MFPMHRSGNPKGRPKGTTKYSEIAKYINSKTHDFKDIANIVIDICKTAKSKSTRLMAAEWLRDTTLGKPRQSMELIGDNNNPVTFVYERADGNT